jgi:hypothetical protein
VNGAVATLAGLVNVTGSNTFNNSLANLTGNYICANNTVTISSATANFGSSGLVSPSVLNLNGTLGGTNTVTILNLMNWTGGTMSGSGRTIIRPGAILNAPIPSGATLDSRTLDNGGTVLWSGTGGISMNTGAVITNRPGALFHFQSGGSFGSFAGGNRIDNAGTFRKSVSTGTATIGAGISFNNSGAVEIRSGILALNGTYSSASNALLNCALGGTTPGTNYGQLRVAGRATLNGALSVDLVNGFAPVLNDSFTVLAAGARTGAFANFFYPSNDVRMLLSMTGNSVMIRVVGATIAVSEGKVLLAWIVLPNETYIPQFNSDLDPANWQDLSGVVTTVGDTASILDSVTTTNRFYRVLVVPDG